MTVVLALACADGVVVASDSQGTEADATRRVVQKVYPLTSTAVWGASGTESIIHDLREAFTRNRDALEQSPDMASSVASLARPVLNEHYQRFVPVPGQQSHSLATSVLAAGVKPDREPWILEMDPNCQMTWYTALGHHTIGSGAPFAQMAAALMAHFDISGKPVAYGKLVVFRALNAVIRTAASGIGPPIQMWVVTQDEALQIDDAELRQIEDLVGGWQQLEIETLESLIEGEDEAGHEEPLPDPAGESDVSPS